jgi:hypothetical protein
MRALRIFAFAGLAASLFAQARVAGPVSGFVYDRGAGRLRPILGIPGASLMGDPVESGYDLKLASIAPAQDAAIVVAADGVVHVLRLNSAAGADRTVDGLSMAPERIVYSPSGQAAALYKDGVVRVIAGLPDAPALGASFDLTAYSAPGALALSDDGAYLMFAAGGSMRLLSNAGDNRALLESADGALAAFAPGNHDAAVVDAVAGVVMIRDAGGNAALQRIAAADDSIRSPAGLSFSVDGKKLLLASAGARGVSIFDLEGGARSDLACDCAPGGLARMGNLFRLNEAGAEPLWLLDAGAAEPRIMFVPALKAE